MTFTFLVKASLLKCSSHRNKSPAGTTPAVLLAVRRCTMKRTRISSWRSRGSVRHRIIRRGAPPAIRSMLCLCTSLITDLVHFLSVKCRRTTIFVELLHGPSWSMARNKMKLQLEFSRESCGKSLTGRREMAGELRRKNTSQHPGPGRLSLNPGSDTETEGLSENARTCRLSRREH